MINKIAGGIFINIKNRLKKFKMNIQYFLLEYVFIKRRTFWKYHGIDILFLLWVVLGILIFYGTIINLDIALGTKLTLPLGNFWNLLFGNLIALFLPIFMFLTPVIYEKITNTQNKVMIYKELKKLATWTNRGQFSENRLKKDYEIYSDNLKYFVEQLKSGEIDDETFEKEIKMEDESYNSDDSRHNILVKEAFESAKLYEKAYYKYLPVIWNDKLLLGLSKKFIDINSNIYMNPDYIYYFIIEKDVKKLNDYLDILIKNESTIHWIIYKFPKKFKMRLFHRLWSEEFNNKVKYITFGHEEEIILEIEKK